jgi:hypothetical protein
MAISIGIKPFWFILRILKNYRAYNLFCPDVSFLKINRFWIKVSLSRLLGGKMENENSNQEIPNSEMQTIPDQPVIDAVGSEGSSKNERPKRRIRLTKKESIAAALVVLAFIVGAGGMYALTGRKENNNEINNQTLAGQLNAKAKPTPTEVVKPVNDKISWLATPSQLGNQNLFSDPLGYYKTLFGDESNAENDISYYLVGTFDKSHDQVIMVQYPSPMVDKHLLIKKSGQTYTVYKQHSPDSFYESQKDGQVEYQGPPLVPGATIDETAVISEIAHPDTFTYSNLHLKSVSYVFRAVDFITNAAPVSTQYITYNKLGDANNGVLYETVTRDEATFKVINYRLLMKDHEIYTYSLSDNLLSTGTPNIVWNNQQSYGEKYKSAVTGCGISNSIEVAKNIDSNDLEVIGKSGYDDQQVYGFKSTSHPLFKKHYDEYVEFYGYDKSTLVSADKFKSDNGVYLAKDGMDRWIVLEKDKYVPQGGCAKPVVYLYPTVPTFVNISIDAQVTLSDPQYTFEGWNKVWALPNGRLIYNQRGYDSLFWEGYGNGFYPDISTGKFVKGADVQKQIKADLYAQGLNDKEVKDFMDFWTPKIPTSPYVRLTWFDTSQMQQLAKLNVWPRPQTMIRVFLDMQGVEKPYDLPVQHLSVTARSGFTVVEWGGLARDGSVPKTR